MTYDELPEQLRQALLDQFEAEQRDNYAMIRHELIEHFLTDPDIAPLWDKWYEEQFQIEMRSPDTEWHLGEWLRDKGLE